MQKENGKERLPGMEDEEIIELFHLQNEKERAFRLLVGKYKERLYWLIRKTVISHEDTDDVLQNVFVKVWEGLNDFRYESQLFTWMSRIAVNESINFLNEKRRKVFGNTTEITEMLENSLESDPWFNGDDIQMELQKAILKLTDRQRIIFNMKYFDDMSYEEIAHVLNVAVGTLKATYHNAVKRIEECMRIADNCL